MFEFGPERRWNGMADQCDVLFHLRHIAGARNMRGDRRMGEQELQGGGGQRHLVPGADSLDFLDFRSLLPSLYSYL